MYIEVKGEPKYSLGSSCSGCDLNTRRDTVEGQLERVEEVTQEESERTNFIG